MLKSIVAGAARAALLAAGVLAAGGGRALAEDAAAARRFTIAAPAPLVESGLLRHLLVRFMLKTQRRGELAPPPADLILGEAGTPAIAQGDRLWRLETQSANDAAARFAAWLTGEVGRAAIAAFTPRQGPAFAPPQIAAAAPDAPVFEGDPTQGARLAAAHCGRCHQTGMAGGYGNLANTPSFAALRALPDWAERFMAFYALNPHPAIMQVEGITPPFDPDRPPAMVPVEITFAEAEAIQAYAATIPAADLGRPVEAR